VPLVEISPNYTFGKFCRIKKMAITVLSRPYGFKFNTFVACEMQPVGDIATVFSPLHGLSSGTYIYILSDVAEYNGFWAINVQTPDFLQGVGLPCHGFLFQSFLNLQVFQH